MRKKRVEIFVKIRNLWESSNTSSNFDYRKKLVAVSSLPEISIWWSSFLGWAWILLSTNLTTVIGLLIFDSQMIWWTSTCSTVSPSIAVNSSSTWSFGTPFVLVSSTRILTWTDFLFGACLTPLMMSTE